MSRESVPDNLKAEDDISQTEIVPSSGVTGKLGMRLATRFSRRSFVAKAGVAGAAFTVAPIRSLVRPESVLASTKVPCVCGGSDCNPYNNKCCDGYTEFCFARSGHNACPDGTFIGGYWQCKSYQGSGLCADTGRRYYLDCNNSPGAGKPDCHCANDNCGCRAVAANHFRYGNCNSQINGKHYVVCRVVGCHRPWENAYHKQCSRVHRGDHHTCSHEPCGGWS